MHIAHGKLVPLKSLRIGLNQSCDEVKPDKAIFGAKQTGCPASYSAQSVQAAGAGSLVMSTVVSVVLSVRVHVLAGAERL